MDEFAWARNNLQTEAPGDLRGHAVSVHTGPHAPYEIKVVDLADGRVRVFHQGQKRPRAGLYADLDGIARYCGRAGLPFAEVEGTVVIEPHS